MTDRRVSTDVPRAADANQPASSAPLRQASTSATPLRARLARARSPEEAEERYLACRNEWTAAMRTATSGKPADMAALAMAQQAYEEALIEHRRWQAGPRVALPVEPDRPRGIEAVVGQELSWRRIHEHDQEKPRGLRRFFGRGKKG